MLRLSTYLRNARRADERGIALTLALLAIVVMGAMVTGTLILGRLDMAGGRSMTMTRQASEATEAGLTDVMANWPRAYNDLAIGTDTTLATVTLGTNLRYTPQLIRLNGGHYLLRVRGDRLGAAGQVLATQSLSRFVRLFIPQLDIQAALTARGNVTIRGNARVDGNDRIPPGWGGCTTGPAKAGVRTDSTTTVSGPVAVVGSPPQVTMDPTVVDSIFLNPFALLTPYATKTLAGGSWNGMDPSLTGGPPVCNESDPSNWGEPYRPPTAGAVPDCYTYFPIVLLNGSTNVQNGRGQGILLIDGDFSMRGNFEFDGIIIATGMFSSQGTGNKVTGAILARLADQFSPTASGNPNVLYSSCAVNRALQYSAHAVALWDRSWAQRYQ